MNASKKFFNATQNGTLLTSMQTTFDIKVKSFTNLFLRSFLFDARMLQTTSRKMLISLSNIFKYPLKATDWNFDRIYS